MPSHTLSETDICDRFITPALRQAGWLKERILREHSFTDGRILVRGRLVSRGRRRRADYLLLHEGVPMAVIEAKDNSHAVGDGMQQALAYAEALHTPFVFASNGDGFVLHDRTGLSEQRETRLSLEAFPAPEELWRRYCRWKSLNEEQQRVARQPYYDSGQRKEPRYYQRTAIQEVVEAIAKGQKRLLLVMATGTGKTFVAFQIIWRLWKAKCTKRVLFLADRNVLVNQTMTNDFRPFAGAMAKLSTSSNTIEKADGSLEELPLALDRQRRIDPSYEIYLGLYQSLTGPEERQKLYRDFSPDFFDLIVVDECHRGSAAEDSAWREILAHFSSAAQLGLTATPKETKYVSNIHYFGEPIYSYSLRQGIRDGFLAPYKVIRVHLDVDVQGYRPRRGEVDEHGREIEDREYNQKDFDRVLVIDERTRRVARWITEYLKASGDRFQPTIVFCVDTEHALLMRQALINENQDLIGQHPSYVVRITGNDTEGMLQLDNFIDPLKPMPVIVTTSRLLSTGVDVQTCKLIVLDREVGSMTEFKQIVGRGTRLHADTDKYYFTLADFRQATKHFADPDFDGLPIQDEEWDENHRRTDHLDNDQPVDDPDELDPDATDDGEEESVLIGDPDAPEDPGLELGQAGEPRRKYYIKGRPVLVLTERVEYLDEQGKLVTESLRDYSRRLVRQQYADLDGFLRRWRGEERKQVILKELAEEGLLLEALQEEVGRELDPFDLICHIAYDQPPLSRAQRAARLRRDVFSRYGPQARAVLEALLEKYATEGVVDDLDNVKILRIPPFSQMGTLVELVGEFGGKAGFERAVHALQAELYPEAA
ncbi:DEAD/DEAH box helicase family protein [Cyanobium sp. FGCU-52]|nr:DEAD/DEAH box helicase family protein [Cyanobium sp. FGCU52]